MTNNKITVRLASPERKYVKVYHDFLDNSLLSVEEQTVFIVLKSFIDFKDDNGEAFPSMETICKRAKMSEKRARKNINTLIKKGIVKKVQRGLMKTNLYEIADFPAMWEAADEQEIKQAVEQGQAAMDLQKYSDEELLKEIERRKKEKEKELESEPTKAQNQAPISNNINTDKNTTDQPESQEERYSMQVKLINCYFKQHHQALLKNYEDMPYFWEDFPFESSTSFTAFISSMDSNLSASFS
ncbi:MAG: helix-turn-helix domain-containing protein [Butyrivibrio sp.]|nr:helix-turn-helix domain-containing protein [Butyrivibrio sp.]